MKSYLSLINKYFPARQVALFLVVGVVCYLVALLLLILFVEVLRMEVNLANLVASIVAIYVAYVLNGKYIFKRGRHSPTKEISAFFLFSFIGLALNVALMFLLTEFVPISYIISKTLVTGIVAAFNFVMRKFLVFNG